MTYSHPIDPLPGRIGEISTIALRHALLVTPSTWQLRDIRQAVIRELMYRGAW